MLFEAKRAINYSLDQNERRLWRGRSLISEIMSVTFELQNGQSIKLESGVFPSSAREKGILLLGSSHIQRICLRQFRLFPYASYFLMTFTPLLILLMIRYVISSSLTHGSFF